MEIPYDFEGIKIYLHNNGYSVNEIQKMGNKKLLELYREESLKKIYEFQDFISADKTLVLNNIKKIDTQTQLKLKAPEIHKDISKLYELIDEFIGYYTYRDFLNILREYLAEIPSGKIEKILKVKYRQMQQVWLENLYKNFEKLPDEQKIPLLKYYEKNQDDVLKLKRVYELSKKENFIQEIQKISETKLAIIKTFMPSLMEENYKAYYDETPEKLELINRIMELTKSYSKKYLKELSIDSLELLEEEIIEQGKRDIQNKKLFKKYVKAFSESIRSMDDEEFSKICREAVNELPGEQLQKVINVLSNKNKFFINRFNAAIKDYQRMTKIKFI